MAKNFKHLHNELISQPGAADALAAARQNTLTEIGLYELRKARRESQTGIAEKLGVSQAAISKLENGTDPKISTLRDYVESLGARLEIHAVFEEGDEETAIPLTIPGPHATSHS